MQHDRGYKKNEHAAVKKHINTAFVKIGNHAFNSVAFILFTIAKVKDDTYRIDEEKASNGEEHLGGLPVISGQHDW